MNTVPVIELKGIYKSFPGVKALSNVDFSLNEGEVVGLCGENGAGKSTLIKMLSGVYQPDSGTIMVAGEKVTIANTRTALNLGISVIYQELNLVPELSIAENLFLGQLPNKCGMIRYGELYEKSVEVLHLLGLDLSPAAKVSGLSLGYRQLIQIGRALMRDAKILVMDEPTSSLGYEDIRRLFITIRHLKKTGYSVIYITHQLEEVFEIADRVTVLRDGEIVETRAIEKWNLNSLVYAMVNRSLQQFYPKKKVRIGEVVLCVENISNQYIHDVTFEARAGEIVAIYGILGAGRTKLIKTLYGVYPAEKGSIRLYDQPVCIRSPKDALAHEIVLVPENRKEEGLILDNSIQDNVILSSFKKISKLGLLNRHKEREMVERAVIRNNIKTSSVSQKVVHLSGGNQQKVVLSRIAERWPKIFLLDEPTRGIDVAGKVELYKNIMNYVENGATVILNSSDLSEVISIADRVVIMREGTIVANLPVKGSDHNVMLEYACGGV